jgi:methylenetetrahydrofolate dehydrogenase (NADP+)/methenyltetrahydrofolate cyclohydrolase
MSCQIIDGNAISEAIRAELAVEVAKFKEDYNVQPRLAVVLIGDDPASQIYVKKKRQACEEVGIASCVVSPHLGHMPQRRLEESIQHLDENEDIHGILVQLPLPKEINVMRIFDMIDPLKDVDVFTPYNVGLLVQGRPRYKPCTPHAVQQLLARSGIPIAGQHVVVINRSNVVGKPLSSMLIQDCDDFANATVTVCHDRTPPEMLEELTRMADIVVVAVGQPGFLTSKMLKPGAVVVDVGITRIDDKVYGDADPSCYEVASYITPVPGGVGPMTVTMLLENTLAAAKLLQL